MFGQKQPDSGYKPAVLLDQPSTGTQQETTPHTEYKTVPATFALGSNFESITAKFLLARQCQLVSLGPDPSKSTSVNHQIKYAPWAGFPSGQPNSPFLQIEPNPNFDSEGQPLMNLRGRGPDGAQIKTFSPSLNGPSNFTFGPDVQPTGSKTELSSQQGVLVPVGTLSDDEIIYQTLSIKRNLARVGSIPDQNGTVRIDAGLGEFVVRADTNHYGEYKLVPLSEVPSAYIITPTRRTIDVPRTGSKTMITISSKGNNEAGPSKGTGPHVITDPELQQIRQQAGGEPYLSITQENGRFTVSGSGSANEAILVADDTYLSHSDGTRAYKFGLGVTKIAENNSRTGNRITVLYPLGQGLYRMYLIEKNEDGTISVNKDINPWRAPNAQTIAPAITS